MCNLTKSQQQCVTETFCEKKTAKKISKQGYYR